MSTFRIPFFMMDTGNLLPIILPNVPLTVNSSKEIRWTETQSPGMSFTPRQFSSFGSQQISFSIILASRGWPTGNLHILKLFEQLRTPVEGLAAMFLTQPSNANPQVLFWYGTGNMLPMIYYVDQVEFLHRAFNNLGFPTITDIDMALTLDEDTLLYKMEKIAREVLALVGVVGTILDIIKAFQGKKPY